MPALRFTGKMVTVFVASLTSSSVSLDLGCEQRIDRVVQQSTADNVEPFQHKMTQFVTQGIKTVFLSSVWFI